MKKIIKISEEKGQTFLKLHGAPRGLLQFYLLHRISLKPSHGYEISQEIDEKTQGAWRPAAGSMYPMLKKMADEGLIRVIGARSGSPEKAQRVYEITDAGQKRLKEGKSMFGDGGRRFYGLRGLFIELLDPEQVSNFLVEGSKMQFETSRDLLNSKMSSISPSDAEFILREYALNLERQLSWTKEKLGEIGQGAMSVTAQARKHPATKNLR